MGMANHVQTSSSWPHSPPTVTTFGHRGNVPCDYIYISSERWASLQNTQRNAYTQLSYRARSDDSGSTGALSVCTFPRTLLSSVQKRIFVTSGAQATDTARCGSHVTVLHDVLIGAPRTELRESLHTDKHSLQTLNGIIFRHVDAQHEAQVSIFWERECAETPSLTPT
jgi:hypothetical protein